MENREASVPLRLHFIATPSGSTAVYVATGSVPFSAYEMVSASCAQAGPPGNRKSRPKAKTARKAVIVRAPLALL